MYTVYPYLILLNLTCFHNCSEEGSKPFKSFPYLSNKTKTLNNDLTCFDTKLAHFDLYFELNRIMATSSHNVCFI